MTTEQAGVLAVAVGVVVLAFCLWALLSPRSMWWVLKSWTFRNPEANEPSDGAYALMRVGGVLGLVGVGIVAAILADASTVSEAEEEERRQVEQEWEEADERIRDAYEPDFEQWGAESLGYLNVQDGQVWAGRPEKADVTPVGIRGYAVVDAHARRPGYLFNDVDGLEHAPAATDDLVLGIDLICEYAGLVVSESPDTVRLSVVHAGEDDAEWRGCSRNKKLSYTGVRVVLIPVDLKKPVGDRRVVDAYSGEPIPQS